MVSATIVMETLLVASAVQMVVKIATRFLEQIVQSAIPLKSWKINNVKMNALLEWLKLRMRTYVYPAEMSAKLVVVLMITYPANPAKVI